jgi:glycosyltransferase involved in cell wall biosynthesis
VQSVTNPISFSIITVARNAAVYIEKCLESVSQQSYSAVEHVVVDGASTDGTQAIVAQHKSRLGACISEPDHGIYDAMNKGLKLAKGDYILFLGADDYLVDANVLTAAAAFIFREQAPDIIYGNLHVRQPGGESTVFRPPPPIEALAFMICGCLPHQATFAHRGVFFDKVGLFDTRYRVHADYDWFLRVLGTGGLTVRHFDRVVGSFFAGGTSSRIEQSQNETYLIQNAFPLFRQPEWVERRLYAFQNQLLACRIQLQVARNGGNMPPGPKLRYLIRRAITPGMWMRLTRFPADQPKHRE